MMMNNCCGPEVPLSKKGQMRMQILRGIILLEFCFAVIAITAGRYFDGVLFIIMTLIGVCVVQTSRKSSMMMACYFIFHLIQAIWGTLYMILYLADVRVYPIPSQRWRKLLLDISIYGLVAIFYAGSIVSYMIFSEVRRIVYAPQLEQMQQQEGPGTSNINDLEAGPGSKQKSPKEQKKPAFTGKGQTLGGGGKQENPWRTGGPPRSRPSRPQM